MKLLTLITAIGLVAAALTTPQAMAQTVPQTSADCIEESGEREQGTTFVTKLTEPKPILGDDGNCRAAESSDECLEHHPNYPVVHANVPNSIGDPGNCRRPNNHTECPDFDPETQYFSESFGSPNTDGTFSDFPRCKRISGQFDCFWHSRSDYSERASHIHVRYDAEEDKCLPIANTEGCEEFFGVDWLVLNEDGACRPIPLEVEELPEIETEDIAGAGTEGAPYVVSDGSLGELKITVSVATGSGDYSYTPADDSTESVIDTEALQDGVVAFNMESTTITTGVYTIAVMVSDEAVDEDGVLSLSVPTSQNAGIQNFAAGLQNIVAAVNLENHNKMIMIHVNVGVANVATNDDTLIATTAESSSNHKPIAVAGLFMAGIFLVNYLYGWEIAKTNWTPSYAYRQDNGNIAYSIGSRWTTTADNMRFYWQQNVDNGKFIYGSGMSYNNGILAAAVNSESDSTITDMDLSLSANKTMGVWTLGGGYNFDMELSETESETKNRVDISANYTQNQWVLSAAAMQIHGTDTESQNRLNIAARYTVDKWILSANANTNGNKAAARINYSYRF